MTGDPLTPTQSGRISPLVTSAGTVNAVLEAARAHHRTARQRPGANEYAEPPGFPAMLTSCYGMASTNYTTSTTTTTTTSTTTTAPPGGGSSATLPCETGYCWKRLQLSGCDFVAATPADQACRAFPLDGNRGLGPGTIVWLEPAGDGRSWVIVAYYGKGGPCPTTTTTTTTAAPCTGGCTWSYSAANKLWTLASDTCSTGAVITSYCPSGIARQHASTLSGFTGAACADLNGTWTWTYTAGNTWYGSLNGIGATMDVDPATSAATITFATAGGDVTYSGTISCTGSWTASRVGAAACSASPASFSVAPVPATPGTGCGCYYPDYCPSCSGSQTTTTACIRGANSYGNHPQCNTTTTTATPAGCTGTCNWKYIVTRGWVNQSNPCLSTCPCPVPTHTPADACADNTASTACTSPPPPPPCSGQCEWKWGDASTGWLLYSSSCAGGYYCACAKPAYSGSVCNETAFTPCAGDPGPTTPPPGSCTGRCYWCWDGTAWTFDRTDCVGCICPSPNYNGSAAGEVGLTSCFSPTTTTTSTTTTTTTSTTTTAAPGYYCAQWANYGCAPPLPPFYQARFCTPSSTGGSVNCGGGRSDTFTIVSGPYASAAACDAACPYGSTTTTTTTTSTTTSTTSTTTTTAAPGGSVKLWYNGSEQRCCNGSPGGGYSEMPGGPWATCAACQMANPGAFFCLMGC